MSAQEPAPDFFLVLDVPESGQYGWSWGTRANRESVEAVFENTQSDIRLSVKGYDIDNGTEVAVLLNGTRLGYLPLSGNNSLGDDTVFEISSEQQIAGSNQLSFVQRVPNWKWGVTDIRIESAAAIVNVSPTAVNDMPSSSVEIGGSLTINVLSNDDDIDGTLDVSSVVTSIPTEAVAQSDGRWYSSQLQELTRRIQ